MIDLQSSTKRQGQFTKLETIEGSLIMINDKNVLCIEVFKQDE